MAIALTCSCGKSLRLKDELAGKRVRCPQCHSVLQVPDDNVENDFEVVGQSEAPTSPEPPTPRRSNISAQVATANVDPSPPPKRRRRRRRDDGGGRSGIGIAISPGVIGGFLMMVVAVVWFIAGLHFGWLFYYPPVLFVLGLIRFIMSLAGHEED